MATSEHVSVQVEYMHTCDYAFVAQNGKPGIIGIFEAIYAPTFPVQHPMMSIAVQLRGQAGHIVPVRLVIEAQDGEKVVELPEQSLSLGKEGGAFLNANLLGLVFKKAARYTITVLSQGAVLATQTLNVVKVEARAA
jgi:hypothetical protein